MPQSLSAVYIHLVFSTKHRYPFIRDEDVRKDLHGFPGQTSKNLECPPIIVGGVNDHVHLLARFGRTITQAEWVKELKRVSSVWLKKKTGFSRFEWQGGYADFSVSQSNLVEVKRYIVNQKAHHQKMSFQDEVRALLKRHEVDWAYGTDATALRLRRVWRQRSQGSRCAATLGCRTKPLRGFRSVC